MLVELPLYLNILNECLQMDKLSKSTSPRNGLDTLDFEAMHAGMSSVIEKNNSCTLGCEIITQHTACESEYSSLNLEAWSRT